MSTTTSTTIEQKSSVVLKKDVGSHTSSDRLKTLFPLMSAAVATAAVMYPVDVLRALKMSAAGDKKSLTIGEYYSKFGWKGFVSQGLIPEIARSSVMRTCKFFFFPIVCEGLHGVGPKEATIMQKATAGALATFPEIFLVTPIEVAKLGLQLDTQNKFRNNMTLFISETYKTRGFSGLYSGWAGLQWRQSFWTGTYFATLQWWKDLVEPLMMQKAGLPQSLSQLTAGFLAGFFASIPCAPGDVVRSVVQKRVFKDPSLKAHGISLGAVAEHFKVAAEIVSVSGIGGLYAGIGFKALHLGGSGAFMAMFIPFFSNLMGVPYHGV